MAQHASRSWRNSAERDNFDEMLVCRTREFFQTAIHMCRPKGLTNSGLRGDKFGQCRCDFVIWLVCKRKAVVFVVANFVSRWELGSTAECMERLKMAQPKMIQI